MKCVHPSAGQKAVFEPKKGQNRKNFQNFLTFLTFEAGIFIKRVIFYYKSGLSLAKKWLGGFLGILLSKKNGKIFYYEKWVVYPPFGPFFRPFPLTHSNKQHLKLILGSRATYFRAKKPHLRPFLTLKRAKPKFFSKNFDFFDFWDHILH